MYLGLSHSAERFGSPSTSPNKRRGRLYCIETMRPLMVERFERWRVDQGVEDGQIWQGKGEGDDAPDIPWPNLLPPDPACSERRKTILALASVCRSLRTTLIPVLWETIEACTAPAGARVNYRPQKRKRWWKTVYKSTVQQLKTVCNRQPSYASYVKTLNILITPYCISTLARELSRTLPLFPNLTTIQITSLWWIDLSCVHHDESLRRQKLLRHLLPIPPPQILLQTPRTPKRTHHPPPKRSNTRPLLLPKCTTSLPQRHT
ncbi:hypothetical protein F5887DRAFT_1089596 [Amanita rubescens]|nr:hypothetical protein F5887DRAFT_1089596 [Amanita rubescens]